MSRIIGIDLGTTNTCVAVLEDSNPDVIANRSGFKTTPSVVALREDGQKLVGHVAKRQAITNPQATVFAAKRLIGRKWDSRELELIREGLPFELVPGLHNGVRISIWGKTYPVEELISFILVEMKILAEEHLQEEVTQAVITVPAYFNDMQRQATRDAGRLAGLEVLRIINEPTAAALAYGKGRLREGGSQRVAVFDLGGGTFDISILEICDGVFEVLATGGDTFLGGEDFDARVIDRLVRSFQREHGIDLRQDTMALQRLKEAAEKAKCELSTVRETEINLPFIYSAGSGEALHLQMALTRELLEEETHDLIERSLDICKRVMRQADLGPEDLDEVVLVGGQTRMPRVQQRVAEVFGRRPCKGVHPDEAVACGAAIQASALAGGSEVLLVDVTSQDLGVMIMDGSLDVIIPRNTRVPTSRSRIFTTVKDNQRQVKIRVFQGEHPTARDNEQLGDFVLANLRPAPARRVRIDVHFDIDADGIVEVTARNSETGEEAAIQVSARSSLTEQEINEIVRKNRGGSGKVQQADELERKLRTVGRTLQEVERLLPTAREVVEGYPLADEALQRASGSLQEGRDAIQRKSAAQLDSALAGLELTLTLFNDLIQLRAPQ